MRFVQYHVRAASGDGGITNSVRRLAEGLARIGVEPEIVADDDVTAPSLDGVTWRQVHHRHVRGVAIPPRLDDVVRGADVVVLNSAWTVHNVAAGRAARRVGVRYVVAPRGAYDPRIFRRHHVAKRVWWAIAERDLVRHAHAIHVFFPSQADDLASFDFRGRLVVAPNGVAVPGSVRWEGTGDYILYVGRFDPEHKGLDLLVRAIASAASGTLPPLRLHGPDQRGGKARLQSLIDALGVGDRVVIGDPVHGDAKWSLMAGALAFAYPSRWEGFGNSTAEAAALGVPTLVTDYPLGAYLAERGAAIIAERTPQALLEGLIRVTSAEGAACSPVAVELLHREFTWDAVACSWRTQVEAWTP